MPTPTVRGARAAVRAATAALALLAAVAVAAPATAQVTLNDPAVELEVLVDGLADPTVLEVLPDGRVLFAQREGRVRIWDPQDGSTTVVARLPVDAYDRSQNAGGQYGEGATCTPNEVRECPAGFLLAEGGIHGMLLDPDFVDNGWVYLYYSPVGTLGQAPDPPKMPGARGPAETEGLFRLSRFALRGDELDLESEEILFENPAEVYHCCHYGGDLEWLSDGTLVMTVGDDTISSESGGFSPHDQRPGNEYNNADATSQNLADRRGKILRIDVRDVDGDGSDVPGGTDASTLRPNPFLEVDGADPYVYALGFRSNYRMAVNPATDHLYVATVGPDGAAPDPRRGPQAQEEIEVVPPGGGTNHGWPRCIGNNMAYNRYDFQTGTAGQPFDCTGMTPAAIWYSYTPSPTSPYVQMQGGGGTAIAGVVYDRPASGALRLPETFDGQFLWGEFSRDQLWRVPVAADGDLDASPATLQPVLVPLFGTTPTLRNPIDAAVGPDGAVYLVEYGNGTWNTTSGRISRITCAGCAPDPADYGLDAVVDPSATLAVAGVEAPAAADARALWAVLGLLALGTAGLAVRTRRRVV